MTMEVLLDLITARNRHTVPEQFLERGIIKQVANFAMVSRYPVMLLQCKWFLQTTKTFTATANTVALPADCWILLGVRINEAKGKCATPVNVRQFDAVQANSLQAGTADYPKYRRDKASIQLYPHATGATNFTGTFDYLRSPSYIDDESTELTDPNADSLPVFHWFLEEEILNEADYQLRERSRGAADAPSAISELERLTSSAMEELRRRSDPLAIYAASLPGKGS